MKDRNVRIRRALLYSLVVLVLAVTTDLRTRVLIGISMPMDETLWLFSLCAVFLAAVFFRRRGDLLRLDGRCLAGALVMTVSTVFSFVLDSETYGSFARKILVTAVVFIAYTLLFNALTRLECPTARSSQPEAAGRRLSKAFAAAAVFLLILLRIYVSRFPYAASADCADQWNMIHGVTPYSDIHAIGHTLFLKAVLSVWDDFTAVILVHIVGVVGLYTALVLYLHKKGVALPWLIFVFGLGLVWSVGGTDAVYYPWKDTPAALCLGVVTLLTARYADTDTLGVPSAALLGLALAWACLFRLNGIVAAGVSGVFFLVSFIKRRQLRQAAALLLCAAVSVAGVRLYSEQVLHTRHLENGFALQALGSGIAAAVHDDEMTEEELMAVAAVLPVDWMRETYDSPLNKRPLIWLSDGSERIAADPALKLLNNELILRMGENKKAVVLLYLRLFPRHAATMLRDFLGSNATVLLQKDLVFVSSHIFQAALLVLLVLCRRLRGKALMVYAPCLCNTLSIMISTVTNEERYLLPSFLLFPFLLVYALQRREPAAAPASAR